MDCTYQRSVPVSTSVTSNERQCKIYRGMQYTDVLSSDETYALYAIQGAPQSENALSGDDMCEKFVVHFPSLFGYHLGGGVSGRLASSKLNEHSVPKSISPLAFIPGILYARV